MISESSPEKKLNLLDTSKLFASFSSNFLTVIRGEVQALVFYAELKLLISGGGDGKIIFWNSEGNIVKQMALFKKQVANLLIFERPKEYDSTFATSQKIKKFVEFKAFRK